MSTEAGVYLTAKHLGAAALASIGAAWAGWRMFFSLKVRQLDELNASHIVLSAKLTKHIDDESIEFEKITKTLERIHTRLDDLWKFLAEKK